MHSKNPFKLKPDNVGYEICVFIKLLIANIQLPCRSRNGRNEVNGRNFGHENALLQLHFSQIFYNFLMI